MKLNAYAKINLTLDVTGLREDGYHLLDTVMQSISLCDQVEILRTGEPGVRLRTDREYLPNDEGNTAYRAAVLFLKHCGLEDEGLEIALCKRIPSRAGLGGGSADAAAVLRGLNGLYGAGLSLEELMKLGEEVGADVPFCVHGGCCRCEGIGERLTELPTLPNCFLALCKPPAGMSTPRAYALLDRYPISHKQATPGMVEALKKGDLRQVAQRLSNRFDQAMRLMQVRDIKKTMLSAGTLGTMMSGSGSAVYGIFDRPQAAENCVRLLEGKGEVFQASPMGPFGS